MTCDSSAIQTGRIGNGPNGAPGAGNNVAVNVNDGATLAVTNTNAISLGDNAIITIGSISGTTVTTVQTTTNNGADSGEYGKGDNTIEFNNNSIVTVYGNGQVIARGTEQTAEAINPIGAGNTILNYGLIKAGASSAIFFENVGTNGASPHNTVDNFGTIDARGGNNPVTGGEAIGSFQNVGIDIRNETGAFIYGNLDLQGGNDTVTLEPQSVITGNLDGGGGTNVLTLDASSASSDMLQGVVKNFQTLNKTGAGTWTLTGSVGQSSGAPLAVDVQGGTLVLTGNNTNFNGSVEIDSGATLEARAQSLPPVINDLHGDLLINQVSPDGVQPNDGTYSGSVHGTGVVTKIGVGTVTLTGVSNYSGGTFLDQGAVAVGADTALGAASGPLTFNGGTLELTNSFNLAATRAITLNGATPGLVGGGTIDTNGFQTTIAQGVTGAGGLTVTDSSAAHAGVAILAGANTYSGGTTIAAGTLQLGNGGTSGSIVGNVLDNGTLAFNRSDTVLFPGLISGSGGVVQAGTGTTIFTQDQAFTGGTVISQGALQLGNGGGTAGNVIGPIVDDGSLIVNRADIPILAGPISGIGSLSQIGTGRTILTGANTYTGGTTITNGTLQVGAGGTTGSIVGNVQDDAALVFDRSDTIVFGGIVSGSGQLGNYGSGTTVLTGQNTYSGGTRVAAGAIQIGDGGTQGGIVGDVSLTSGTLIFNRSDVVTFPGLISGAGGSVVQAGTGTTILTANNTYTAGTSITGGTLQLGNGGTTGAIASDAVADGGNLAFNRSDIVTVPYLISGSGNVSQIGSGTTILTANNVYTGTTTISAGTLQLGNGGSSGRVAGDVIDNAALVFDRSDVNPFGGHISGTGAVTQAGTGATILTAASTYTGGTTITAGTLQLGYGGTSGGIIGNVLDNGALAFDRSDIVTFSGVISGSGVVNQIGAGATILNAVNPYTGATNVLSGALAIGDSAHASAALSGGGLVSIAAGATFGGYGSTAGDVVSGGTVAVATAFPAFAGGPGGTFTIGGDFANEGLAKLAGGLGAVGNVLSVGGAYGTGATAGVIEMNTLLNSGGPLANQFTDRMLVFGAASGTTSVNVNAFGAGAYTTTETPSANHGISIIQVAGASSQSAFALAGGYVTGGSPYEYRLYAFGPGSSNGAASASQSLVGNAGSNWDYRLESVYVSPIGPTPPGPQPEPSRPELAPQVPNYISIPTALFSAGLQNLDSLHRRLGEIRDEQNQGASSPDGDVFIRGFGSGLDYQTNRGFLDYGFDSKQDYAATQAGANVTVHDDPNGALRVGLAAVLGKLWIEPSAIDGSSNSAFDSETMMAIATYQSRAGWYVDAILSAGMFNGNVSTALRGTVAGIDGSSYGASLEAGYPIPLGFAGLALEPQAQLIYQRLDFGQQVDSDSIRVNLGGQNAWVVRGGARLTDTFRMQDGSRVTPYLKANVLYGFGDGGDVTIGSVPFATGRLGTSVQVGAGATGSLAKNISIYGEVSWQNAVGGAGLRGWAGNGGLRYAF